MFLKWQPRRKFNEFYVPRESENSDPSDLKAKAKIRVLKDTQYRKYVGCKYGREIMVKTDYAGTAYFQYAGKI